MESEETTHLLFGKLVYGSRKRQQDAESINDDLRYSVVDPSWMNVRLCIFWSLWATLIVVSIITILSYYCYLWQTCPKSDDEIILNETNT